jgi:hypothetical protein
MYGMAGTSTFLGQSVEKCSKLKVKIVTKYFSVFDQNAKNLISTKKTNT